MFERVTREALLINISREELIALINDGRQICLTCSNNKKLLPVELLTVKEAASFLKVTEVSIYNWIKKKLIPYHRIASHILFNKEELLEATLVIPSQERKNKKV